MKKIKILEVGPYPPPLCGWGIRIKLIKEELLKRGYECVVLNIGKSRKIKNLEYIDVQNGLDCLFKIIKYSLKGYTPHLHINGSTDKGLIIAICGEIIGLITNKRSFLTFHAGVNQDYFPKNNNLFLTFIFYFIFTLAKKIICNSIQVKEEIIKYGINPNKIIPIPAFCPQYMEDFKEKELGEDLNKFIENHPIIIFSYIFVIPAFKVDTLLIAIKNLLNLYPNLGLILVVGDNKLDEIKALINLFKLNLNNIFIIGNTSHEVFLNILSKSTLYVRLPERDGICASVLEAISMKIPVVASKNVHRPKEIVTFEGENAEDLQQKIIYVLNNYETVKNKLKVNKTDTLSEEIEVLIS